MSLTLLLITWFTDAASLRCPILEKMKNKYHRFVYSFLLICVRSKVTVNEIEQNWLCAENMLCIHLSCLLHYWLKLIYYRDLSQYRLIYTLLQYRKVLY